MEIYAKQLTDKEIKNFLAKNLNLSEAEVNLFHINHKEDGRILARNYNGEFTSKTLNFSFSDFELKEMYNRCSSDLNLKYLKFMLEKFKDNDKYISHLMQLLKKEEHENKVAINRYTKKLNDCRDKQKFLFGDTLENLEKIGEQLNTNSNANQGEQTSVFDSGEQLTIAGTDEQQPE